MISSAYFSSNNFGFMSYTMFRNNICYRCLDIFEVKPEFREFLSENKINFVQCDVGFNQEPFLVMSDEKVCEVLRFLLNPDNQPTLLFCRDGKVMLCASTCVLFRYLWLTSIISL